jgi:hypothetical protein
MKVCVRMRRILDAEKAGSHIVMNSLQQSVVQLTDLGVDLDFRESENVLTQEKSQASTYIACGAQEMCRDLFSGKSSCIIAMGPRNSGKTYTIFGVAEGFSSQGILPRLASELLELASSFEGSNRPSVMLTCFQIQTCGGEKVRDLLSPQATRKTMIVLPDNGGAMVEGLSDIELTSQADILIITERALRSARQSTGHTIFSLKLRGASHSRSAGIAVVETVCEKTALVASRQGRGLSSLLASLCPSSKSSLPEILRPYTRSPARVCVIVPLSPDVRQAKECIAWLLEAHKLLTSKDRKSRHVERWDGQTTDGSISARSYASSYVAGSERIHDVSSVYSEDDTSDPGDDGVMNKYMSLLQGTNRTRSEGSATMATKGRNTAGEQEHVMMSSNRQQEASTGHVAEAERDALTGTDAKKGMGRERESSRVQHGHAARHVARRSDRSRDRQTDMMQMETSDSASMVTDRGRQPSGVPALRLLQSHAKSSCEETRQAKRKDENAFSGHRPGHESAAHRPTSAPRETDWDSSQRSATRARSELMQASNQPTASNRQALLARNSNEPARAARDDDTNSSARRRGAPFKATATAGSEAPEDHVHGSVPLSKEEEDAPVRRAELTRASIVTADKLSAAHQPESESPSARPLPRNTRASDAMHAHAIAAHTQPSTQEEDSGQDTVFVSSTIAAPMQAREEALQSTLRATQKDKAAAQDARRDAEAARYRAVLVRVAERLGVPHDKIKGTPDKERTRTDDASSGEHAALADTVWDAVCSHSARFDAHVAALDAAMERLRELESCDKDRQTEEHQDRSNAEVLEEALATREKLEVQVRGRPVFVCVCVCVLVCVCVSVKRLLTCRT